MSVILGALTALVYTLKILAWFVPLILFQRAIVWLDRVGSVTPLQGASASGIGLAVGVLLRWADTRDFIGVGFSPTRFEVSFFDAQHFWREAYFDFWRYWVNPLAYPYDSAAAAIVGPLPHYLGAAVGVILIAYCAFAGWSIRRTGRNNALALAGLTVVAVVGGTYAIYLLAWLWAVLGLPAAFMHVVRFRARMMGRAAIATRHPP
jgi:hypothetical protein